MNPGNLKFNILRFNSLESTNSYARELLRAKNVQNGTVIQSLFQKDGRGQRENSWESEEGKNLLISIVLKVNLAIDNQFVFNQSVALGIKNCLDSLSVKNVSIKWPNDILINSEKVAGIRIENSISDGTITETIIGIGLNVNQEYFQNYNRNATSLYLESRKMFDLKEVEARLLTYLKAAWIRFKSNPELIEEEYARNLYGFQKELNYQDLNSKFKGTIIGINKSGKIQLSVNSEVKEYDFKEVVLLD